MTKREYKIDPEKKEVRLTKSGYKGIKSELSSVDFISKCIAWSILDSIYITNFYDHTMWFSKNCRIDAIAKCDDEDKFDEKIGMQICDAKADLKYHNMMYNRYVYIDYVLGKLKLAIAKLEKKHLEKIERLEKDLDQYVR